MLFGLSFLACFIYCKNLLPSQIQLKTSNWGFFIFDTGGFRSNTKKRVEIFYLPRAPRTVALSRIIQFCLYIIYFLTERVVTPLS
jgi:hypothetical protein